MLVKHYIIMDKAFQHFNIEEDEFLKWVRYYSLNQDHDIRELIAKRIPKIDSVNIDYID